VRGNDSVHSKDLTRSRNVPVDVPRRSEKVARLRVDENLPRGPVGRERDLPGECCAVLRIDDELRVRGFRLRGILDGPSGPPGDAEGVTEAQGRAHGFERDVGEARVVHADQLPGGVEMHFDLGSEDRHAAVGLPEREVPSHRALHRANERQVRRRGGKLEEVCMLREKSPRSRLAGFRGCRRQAAEHALGGSGTPAPRHGGGFGSAGDEFVPCRENLGRRPAFRLGGSGTHRPCGFRLSRLSGRGKQKGKNGEQEQREAESPGSEDRHVTSWREEGISRETRRRKTLLPRQFPGQSKEIPLPRRRRGKSRLNGPLSTRGRTPGLTPDAPFNFRTRPGRQR
jgi:hypothetical protein